MEQQDILKYAIPAGVAIGGFLSALCVDFVVKKISSKRGDKPHGSSRGSSNGEGSTSQFSDGGAEEKEEETSKDPITSIPSFYVPRLVSHPIRASAKDAFDLLKGLLSINIALLFSYHILLMF